MKLKPFRRVPLCIALGVILVVCLLQVWRLDFLERIEEMTYDMRVRQAARFPSRKAANLGFVYIDEQSVAKVHDGSLGFRFGLYWPRQVYGRLIDELSSQGAKAVGLDIIFGDLRPDHASVGMADGSFVESDVYFADEMRRASNVVLALTREVTPPELFLTNAWALGDISIDKDQDGVLRRAKLFRRYRQWHWAFRKLEEDREYGVDLRHARVQKDEIVLPREGLEPIRVPLDQEGNFDLKDFFGSSLPAGAPRKAKPFTDQRVWHMGVVLAARELNLDLNRSEIDLAHGRVILRSATGLQRAVPVDSKGYFYIDWCMRPNDPQLLREPIQNLLLQNRLRLLGKTNGLVNTWSNKLVVVGSGAVVGNDLTDRGATPLQADTLLVSKHWNVANSILTGRFVQRSTLGLNLALIALLGLLAAVITWELRPVLAFALVLLLAGAYVGFGVVLYIQTRFWIPLVLPVTGAILMNHVCLMAWRVVFEQAERRRVKSIFSTVVSPKIMHELLRAKSLALGGERREVTVLFSDVRGFTEFTDVSQEEVAELVRREQLGPEAAEALYKEQARRTLDTVNTYLGLVADTCIKHDGILDKFIGDCVMAFWGAPPANPRQALASVQAAIEAQRAIADLNKGRARENESLEVENRARASAGLPPKPLLPILSLGTGINTGLVTVGLMGSGTKTRNYTVFGREVNLASRLESQSGRGHIYISVATYEHLRRDDPALAATCVPLPSMTVKGFRTAVQVYEVPWETAQPAAPESRSASAPTGNQSTLPA